MVGGEGLRLASTPKSHYLDMVGLKLNQSFHSRRNELSFKKKGRYGVKSLLMAKRSREKLEQG